MLHFIDQTSVGQHHMAYNASMISILLSQYPDHKITLHGLSSNHEAIVKMLSASEVNRLVYRPIEYPAPIKETIFFKAINYYKKEQVRKTNFKEIAALLGKDDIVFYSISTFSSFLDFKKIFSKIDNIVLITLHGDLDFLYHANSQYDKLNAWYQRKVFKIKKSTHKYVLLNKICKRKILDLGVLEENELLEINHPYAASGLVIEGSKALSNPIKIGHIGSMEKERKNSHYIYTLAQGLEKLIQDQQLIFQAIGLSTPSVSAYKNNLVEELVGNDESNRPKYLSREDYEKYLKDIHYSIFFYPEHEYVFRASGAIPDTICFEKPIFTLKHPYFQYMFDTVGNIGYMFDTLEEMKAKIIDIVNNGAKYKAEYDLQIQNLKKFKDLIDVRTVQNDLFTQLKKKL